MSPKARLRRGGEERESETEGKMEVGWRVPFGGRVAITVFALSIVFFLSVSAQEKCSRTCVARNCNTMGIRYGKYCGVGWTGCTGEKPCDDVDACCKTHDECTTLRGVTNIQCHEKFKKCIKKVRKTGKVGFSRECPYDIVVPTMAQGMDMAIMLSNFGSKLEL